MTSELDGVVGIDLGSTTTKAVLLDLDGNVVGRGVTNSRSSYDAASAVAWQEAVTDARLTLLRRALGDRLPAGFGDAFRLELHRLELAALRRWMEARSDDGHVHAILDDIEMHADEVYGAADKKSDFFRDLTGAAYMHRAERLARSVGAPFERVMAAYDRAILEVEAHVVERDFEKLFIAALARTMNGGLDAERREAAATAARTPIRERSFVGTGYGRQTLPFPPEAQRSEILCHGRGAHHQFPGTRSVLDIGGQDTKAMLVDEMGVVTSFQMNDRCAAGCGRYLGYVADELNLGLHELGPLAMAHKRVAKVNSTCTVFAGAELKERLGLGERREDILAGLHKAILLRAMALIARAGGVRDQFTFTGGVARNAMAVHFLRQMVGEAYGTDITLNVDPGSIYAGALGAALFALDDLKSGNARSLPGFGRHSERRVA